jgi:hypothetical protein
MFLLDALALALLPTTPTAHLSRSVSEAGQPIVTAVSHVPL